MCPVVVGADFRMSPAPLLAPELLLQIFGHLDTAAQLCVASRVSRLWHRVSNDDSLWLDLCLKAGIEVPLESSMVARHVALVMVAARQSLVRTTDTFIDMSALPFDEFILWRLCRETLEAACISFPFTINGQPDLVTSSPCSGVLRSSSVDSSQWSESSYAHSDTSRGRGISTSRPTLAPGEHSWKLMQLPLLLRFVPTDIEIVLPHGMAQLKVLYSAYATLYRDFWDAYPLMKHLSRRLEKWLTRQLPTCFQYFAKRGMSWRRTRGTCPIVNKPRLTGKSPFKNIQGDLYFGSSQIGSGVSRSFIPPHSGINSFGVSPDRSILSNTSKPQSSASMGRELDTSSSESVQQRIRDFTDLAGIDGQGPEPSMEVDIESSTVPEQQRPAEQLIPTLLVGGDDDASTMQVYIGVPTIFSKAEPEPGSSGDAQRQILAETPVLDNSETNYGDQNGILEAHPATVESTSSRADSLSIPNERSDQVRGRNPSDNPVEDLFVSKAIVDDVQMDVDGSSGSEALTHVEDEAMEELSTASSSRKALLRGDVLPAFRDESTSFSNEAVEGTYDDSIWTFANLQFIPQKASKSFKELILFYHLFRDGQRQLSSTPFGLFGSYLCGDAFVSIQMRPSKHLKLEQILDLGVLNFATCLRTGKSLSLVVACPEAERSTMLWRVIHMNEVSRTYQDFGTFGQFLDKYVMDIEQGLHSIGTSSQNPTPEIVEADREWAEVLFFGSKIERAIRQRKQILASKANSLDETSIRQRQHELKSLEQLMGRLPPNMPVPLHLTTCLPPNSISMFPNFSPGSGVAHSKGVEVRPSCLSSINASDINRKSYRVRIRYLFFSPEDGTGVGGQPTLKAAFNDLMSPEYEGTATSHLIDVHRLEAAVMSANNSLFDKSTLYHRFPQSRRPFTLTIPTAAAQALGINVSTTEPLVSINATFELMVIIVDMMSNFMVNEPRPEQCQLLSRHWVVRYRSGATQVVEGEGVVGQFPIMSVETAFFEYCSFVPDQPSDPCIWIEGKFTFVPGSLQAPTGPPFEVQIPRIVFPTLLKYDESSVSVGRAYS
ncbi:hypothetical protein BJ742DRAFT_790522 [Cladochytrium replicatum]|nr:hypothetical protein BJ742DRAFT_790522 [Cladochytrium replicatum]